MPLLSLRTDTDDNPIVALPVDFSARDLNDNPVIDGHPAESAAPWSLRTMLAGAIRSLLCPPMCS